MINLWPFLLPLAAGSGWLFASRHKELPAGRKKSDLNHQYVIGLNYLLNEQPDKAVDIFIQLLDVDDETVETHLALGSLFRRRGEVDRAIRIHQNLIARPELSEPQRQDALMALGQDYLSAGVYDRAERIFKEITQLNSNNQRLALRYLLDIYQQEKAWEQAIGTAKQLEEVSHESMHIPMSHYFCELAKGYVDKQDYKQAVSFIKKAVYIDKHSVRASLLQAEIELKQHRLKAAIKYYKQIPEQDADYVSEIIWPLYECHKSLGMLEQYMTYLKQLMNHHPRASIIFVLSRHLYKLQGVEPALDYAAEQLNLYPSLKGLNELISWHVETSHGKVRSKLNILYDITSKLLKNKPIYRCGACGFGGKHLHWQCPSCRKWSTIKPIHGLEGD